MRQSWYFRLLGLLMLPLYATGAWVAPALQVCPMHGSPAGAHASMQMAGHEAHQQHAMPQAGQPENQSSAQVAASSSGAGSVASADAPGNSHKHGCDCLGCCASPNGPGIPVTQVAHLPPAIGKHKPFELKNAEVAVTRLAYVLPFATAPPNTLV